jgi:hypothetical protein
MNTNERPVAILGRLQSSDEQEKFLTTNGERESHQPLTRVTGVRRLKKTDEDYPYAVYTKNFQR